MACQEGPQPGFMFRSCSCFDKGKQSQNPLLLRAAQGLSERRISIAFIFSRYGLGNESLSAQSPRGGLGPAALSRERPEHDKHRKGAASAWGPVTGPGRPARGPRATVNAPSATRTCESGVCPGPTARRRSSGLPGRRARIAFLCSEFWGRSVWLRPKSFLYKRQRLHGAKSKASVPFPQESPR